MPPWHADPAHGEFLNDRRLSAAEKDTLLRVGRTPGRPEGDPDGSAGAADVRRAAGRSASPTPCSRCRRTIRFPATGTIAYQYFEVPTNAHGRQLGAGVRGAARQPRRRAPRDRLRAAARGAGRRRSRRRAQQSRAASAAGRITFADGMDIPAGQTGGPALPDGQKRNAGPNDRPTPKQLGPSVGGYVPGNGYRVYQPGTAIEAPRRARR